MATIRRRYSRVDPTKVASFQVRWRDPSGDEKERNFKRRRDADNFLIEVESDMRGGKYVDPRAGDLRFGVYARQWLAIQVHRPSTREKIESNLRNHVYPRFEHQPLSSIRRSDLQAWVKDRQRVLGASTLEVVATYLRSILKSAVRDKLLAESPWDSIPLPEVNRDEVIPPTIDQVRALQAAMPARYRALVPLAAGTGLRQGECFGLESELVTFMSREPVVRVHQQLVQPSKGKQYVGPPKTKASRRTVPAPAMVTAALAAHLAEFPPVEVELLDRRSGRDQRGTFALIFTTSRKNPMRRNNFTEDIWYPALEKAKLPSHFGFHDLRHFYASLLIEAGNSPKVVQRRLGHASITETLDTYGHLWPDSDGKTRSAIDDAFAVVLEDEDEAGEGDA